jgi:hypothetical protein
MMTLFDALQRIRNGLRDGLYFHDPGSEFSRIPYHDIRLNDEEGPSIGVGDTEADAVIMAAEWLMLDENAKTER